MSAPVHTSPDERQQSAGRSSSESSHVQRRSGLVGKSLAEQQAMLAPVQRRPGGAAEGDVHAAAQRGIQGAGGPLPHAEAIQASFGSHDVSGVQAHVGVAAAEATAAMGAEAYATGNHTVFGGAPSLHTAAHEAAHVVQQRGGVSLKGGVGEAGDAYEQHADRVAEAVVRGESSEGLLDQVGGGAGSGAVQRAPSSGVQRLLTDNDELGGDLMDRPSDELISEATAHRMERSEEALAAKDKLLAIAERSRRPGRDPKYDAFKFVYHMLEHFLPNVREKYDVAGVEYDDSLRGVRVDKPGQGRDVMVGVGSAFVVETTEANWNYQLEALRARFNALGTSAAGMLDEKLPGTEIEQISASCTLAAGAIVESFWADVLVPKGGATARITVTSDHLRVDITPHLYIDAAGVDNATFHGFTYRFDDKQGGVVDIKEGQDIRKAGLGGPLGDVVVSKGADTMRDLLKRMTAGSCFARPGFNPLQTPKDELLGGVEVVKANFQAYKGEKGGDEAAPAEGEDEGYGAKDISDLSASALLVYKPGYSSMSGGMGIQLDPGASFSVSMSTGGTAADISEKGIDGAKLKQLAVSTPSGLGLWYGGQRIASLHGVQLNRGMEIETSVTLNPPVDLVCAMRKQHPSWFTQGLDETIEAVDATLLPLYLLSWGLGGDVMSGPSGKPETQAFRKGVVDTSVGYLQSLAEWEASAIAKNMFIASAGILQSSTGITPAQLQAFVGVKPIPAVSLLGIVQAVKDLGASGSAVAALIGGLKSQVTEVTEQMGSLVAVGQSIAGEFSGLAAGLQEDIARLKGDIDGLSAAAASFKEDVEAIQKGAASVVDGAKGLADTAGAVADGVGDLVDAAGDLADLVGALTD